MECWLCVKRNALIVTEQVRLSVKNVKSVHFVMVMDIILQENLFIKRQNAKNVKDAERFVTYVTKVSLNAIVKASISLIVSSCQKETVQSRLQKFLLHYQSSKMEHTHSHPMKQII